MPRRDVPARASDTKLRAAPPQAADAPALIDALLRWYDRARRDLPWRARPGEPADPWAVLVSEIMLQQTQVAFVAPRFGPFMARFPTLRSMAAARLDDVLHAWQGLGYYRRARALHACAVAVVERHGGELPADPQVLAALPGLGAYTATAVAAIAFDVPGIPVDGNVRRVLSRLRAIDAPAAETAREVARAAVALRPRDRAADVAQAVMELGALVCTPRNPGCLVCPWRDACAARRAGIEHLLPRPVARAERRALHGIVFVLTRGDGAVLFRRRPDTGLLAGMIELPGTAWTEQPPDDTALREAAPADISWRALPGSVEHAFTHLDLSLGVLAGEIETGPAGLWATPREFATLALPQLTTKILRHAIDTGVAPVVANARRKRP